nr:unnamed protein product [uncultured bacterium]
MMWKEGLRILQMSISRKKNYEINLQRAEIDKQIQKILEEEKKLKEKNGKIDS